MRNTIIIAIVFAGISFSAAAQNRAGSGDISEL